MKFHLASISLAIISILSGCAYNSNLPANRHSAGLYQLRIGMPQGQAVALVGQPLKVNQTTTAAGVSQQYVYSSAQFQTPGQQFFSGMQEGADGVSRQRAIYLYFQNGRLTTIQN